jgi:hypothetical protein
MDPAVAIGWGDKPPPLFLCADCSSSLTLAYPQARACDMLRPVESVPLKCEYKVRVNCILLSFNELSI